MDTFKICSACGKKYNPLVERPEYSNYIKNTPFFCSGCGWLRFDLRAIRGKVILYPLPPDTMFEGSKIIIPVQYQEFYKSWKAVVLSVGSGYYEQSGEFVHTVLKVGDFVIFNRDVPWYSSRRGVDGRYHPVVLCGERDVWMLVEDDNRGESKEV